MLEAIQRCYEAITALDIAIRKQRKQAATCGAMQELERLERARACVYEGQMILVRLDNETTRREGGP